MPTPPDQPYTVGVASDGVVFYSPDTSARNPLSSLNLLMQEAVGYYVYTQYLPSNAKLLSEWQGLPGVGASPAADFINLYGVWTSHTNDSLSALIKL